MVTGEKKNTTRNCCCGICSSDLTPPSCSFSGYSHMQNTTKWIRDSLKLILRPPAGGEGGFTGRAVTTRLHILSLPLLVQGMMYWYNQTFRRCRFNWVNFIIPTYALTWIHKSPCTRWPLFMSCSCYITVRRIRLNSRNYNGRKRREGHCLQR